MLLFIFPGWKGMKDKIRKEGQKKNKSNPSSYTRTVLQFNILVEYN